MFKQFLLLVAILAFAFAADHFIRSRCESRISCPAPLETRYVAGSCVCSVSVW